MADSSQTTLQVLMPMGGLGSRFAKEGYKTPKPLIPVDGKPMFMRALDSFKDVGDVRHIFVIRKEHDEQYGLAKQIKEQLPDAKISILDHDTGGAAETCLIGEADIDDDLPITIADCDIYFESKAYFDKVAAAGQNGRPDGLLLTFPSDDPRYSYVELDGSGKVIRTAEKIVISNHALLGGYFFRSGKLFKEVAKEFVGAPLPDGLKEYFMSHLFNMLLEKNLVVETADIDTMHIFGTPEELNAYFEKTGQPAVKS
jgi:NDP-sugar pyrophosphorylase family protein